MALTSLGRAKESQGSMPYAWAPTLDQRTSKKIMEGIIKYLTIFFFLHFFHIFSVSYSILFSSFTPSALILRTGHLCLQEGRGAEHSLHSHIKGLCFNATG